MLRIATSRLATAAPRQARAFSRTTPALIRIKKQDGSTSLPGDAASSSEPAQPAQSAQAAKPAQPAQPSPAQQPSSIPSDIKPPKSFEPEVNTASKAAPNAETAEASPLGSAVPPSEPPAPGASAEEPPAKPDLSSLPSLDIDPEANAPAIEQPKEDAKGKRGGAGGKKRPEYVSSIERRRRFMTRMGLAALVLGGIGSAVYFSSVDDGKHKGSAWERLKGNFTEMADMFSKPAFEQLLPDPLPAPHQRPYTLLVDLEDLLVHSTWDRQHGWRTAKRPGVDYFLAYLSQFYEIVLFTSQPFYTAGAVAEKLDPFTLYIPYKLFREATRFADGHVVKDLSYLNRDLSKVVMLDTNAEHASLQPDNAIILKPWDGKPGDRGLVEMIPFLESIGIYAPADVRPVLKHYAGKDIPREYAKKEAEMKAQAIAEWERTHPTAAAGSGGSWIGGLFGGSSATAQRPKVPMTYLEIKRAQAQRAYEEEQKYYREHAEEFTKLIEEDKARQMAEQKHAIMGFFGAGGSKEDPAAAAAAAAAPGAPKTEAAK